MNLSNDVTAPHILKLGCFITVSEFYRQFLLHDTTVHQFKTKPDIFRVNQKVVCDYRKCLTGIRNQAIEL